MRSRTRPTSLLLAMSCFMSASWLVGVFFFVDVHVVSSCTAVFGFGVGAEFNFFVECDWRWVVLCNRVYAYALPTPFESL